MKIGVADYGMNVWDGGNFDYEDRLLKLKGIGYEGTERLVAASTDDAIHYSSMVRKLGMDFATCLAPNPELCIKYTSALRKDYVWVNVTGKDFDTYCRQVNTQTEICKKWGINVAVHNHMGSLVETQEQVELFLSKCPGCKLILDTAHLAAVSGDPIEIIKRYPERLQVLHLKDWLSTDPGNEVWHKRGRFCELGAGNIGLDNIAVLKTALEIDFDGWVFIEQDVHLQDPMKDLAISREYLLKAGF